MSKPKRKHKNDEHSIFQQVVGCTNMGIRILAGILMLVFIGTILLLFYAKSQSPEFEIAVWVAMSAFFAYLCGYIAFNQSKKAMSSQAQVINRELGGLLRLIMRTLAGFGLLIFGGGIFLLFPMIIQHPEWNLIIFFVMNLVLALVSAVLYFTLRPIKESDLMRDNHPHDDYLDDDSSDSDTIN